MALEPGVSFIFPSNGSTPQHSLPSAGSLGSVPPPPRYYGVLRHPAALLASLRFSSFRDTTLEWRRRGFPGSWGALYPYMPCSTTPAGPQGPDPWFILAVLPSATEQSVGSCHFPISGFNHTACMLAVYASQCCVATTPRKTRFRLVVLLNRAGFEPTELRYEVSATIASSPSRLRLAHVRLGDGECSNTRPLQLPPV